MDRGAWGGGYCSWGGKESHTTEVSEPGKKKESEKHVHVTESLCRTPETKATLEINYTSIFKKEKGREGNEDAECK